MIGRLYERTALLRRPGVHAQYFGWDTGETADQMEYNYNAGTTIPTNVSSGGGGTSSNTSTSAGDGSDSVSNYLSTLLKNLGPIYNAIQSVAGPVAAQQIIKKAIDQVAQQQTGAADQIKNLLTQSGQNQQNYITGGLNTGTGQIMQGATMANNALQQQEQAAQNTIQNYLPQNQAALTSGYNQGINTLRGALGNQVGAIQGALGNQVGSIQGALANQVGSLQSGYGNAQNTLQDYLGQAMNAIGQGYGAAIGGINPYAQAGGNALNALLAGYGMGPTGPTIPGATNMQAYQPQQQTYQQAQPQQQVRQQMQQIQQAQQQQPEQDEWFGYLSDGFSPPPANEAQAKARSGGVRAGTTSAPFSVTPSPTPVAQAPTTQAASGGGTTTPSYPTTGTPTQNGQPYQRDPALQSILMNAGGGMMGLIDTMHTLQNTVSPGTGSTANPLQFSDPTAAIQAAVNSRYNTPAQTIAQLQAGGATPTMVDQAMGWSPGTAQNYFNQFSGVTGTTYGSTGGTPISSTPITWGAPIQWGSSGSSNALAPSSGSAIPGLPSFVRGIS
jgi:hypothetical protein